MGHCTELCHQKSLTWPSRHIDEPSWRPRTAARVYRAAARRFRQHLGHSSPVAKPGSTNIQAQMTEWTCVIVSEGGYVALSAHFGGRRTASQHCY